MTFCLERTKSFKRNFKKLRLSDKEEAAYIEVVYHLLSNKNYLQNIKIINYLVHYQGLENVI